MIRQGAIHSKPPATNKTTEKTGQARKAAIRTAFFILQFLTSSILIGETAFLDPALRPLATPQKETPMRADSRK
jgi:hypothetical protein